MTYPGMNGRTVLADLDPTDSEIQQLNDALAELGGYPPGGGDDDDLGPWDDELGEPGPGLAYELDPDALELAADPAEVGYLLDLANVAEAQRLAEDAEPLPVRAEDRTAWLIDRLERGTYRPGPMFTADLSGEDAAHGCGTLDEFGRCGSRFHDAYCFETVRVSAATGNAEAAAQFRDALMANTATAVELASRTGPGFDDLLEDPGPADVETLSAMRELLGLPSRGHRPGPVRPAVQITPQELGIY